ncbi:PqqD family protein [Actinoplanes sp. N902-109]|uniref:PqqD family protein n=1 Tax=Actinoplanes sp. (strain N902-109) TaxID=649831 RepID=UPI0003295CB2|nr:PqqD family protein [Actinoplanes sp. N902-109]AGL17727.1 hypothetical protein L083_4217 [Actinoplanes sp. N902-109]
MSLHISEDVIWNETPDGVSLYHTATGEFRSLNPSAARIWMLVADGDDRDTVVTRLRLLYGASTAVARERIGIDVARFLDTMVEQGMLDEKVAA